MPGFPIHLGIFRKNRRDFAGSYFGITAIFFISVKSFQKFPIFKSTYVKNKENNFWPWTLPPIPLSHQIVQWLQKTLKNEEVPESSKSVFQNSEEMIKRENSNILTPRVIIMSLAIVFCSLHPISFNPATPLSNFGGRGAGVNSAQRSGPFWHRRSRSDPFWHRRSALRPSPSAQRSTLFWH